MYILQKNPRSLCFCKNWGDRLSLVICVICTKKEIIFVVEIQLECFKIKFIYFNNSLIRFFNNIYGMHFHWIFLRTSLYCGRINSIFIISFIYISLSSRQQNLDVVPTMKMKTLVNTNNSSTIKKTKTDNTQKNYYVFSIMLSSLPLLLVSSWLS